jgi:tetratricopeptide (TPR) repeat protein
MARRGASDPFGPDDGGWLAVAALVGHAAAHARDVVSADALIMEAAELANTILGQDSARSDVARESHADPEPVSRIVIAQLAERIEKAGALYLAASMYEGLSSADPALPSLERGRLLAKLARVMRKLGRVDDASSLYRRLIEMAKATHHSELEARALLGYTSISQMRGDYVAVRRYALRAARIARRNGDSALLRLAHQGLMIAAIKLADYSTALVYGWSTYELAVDDPVARDDALTNIGQLLADTGNFAAARAAFATVLTRPQPVFIGLPALGGLAVAAARLHDDDTLNWSATQLLREIERFNQPYEIALALLECGTALASVGRAVQAEECRQRAIALSSEFGFPELLERATGLDTTPELVEGEPNRVVEVLRSRARGIARKIEALNPRHLPEHVELRAVA